MIFFKKNALIVFICCLAVFISCRQKTKPVVHDHIVRNKIITTADSMLNAGTYAPALKYVDSAYTKFKNPGIEDLWAMYEFKAYYFLDIEKNSTPALPYADSMLAVLKGNELNYRNEYASTLFTKGDILMEYQQFAPAYKLYYDSRLFARKYLDSCNISEISRRLGALEFNRRNYLQAVPFFKQALSEIKYCKGNSDDEFTKSQGWLNTIGLTFERANMPDSAIYYYRQALDYIDEKKNQFPSQKQFAKIAKGVVYGNLGGTYYNIKRYADAEKYLLASIHINEVPGYAVADAQSARVKLIVLYLQESKLSLAAIQLKKLESYLKATDSKSENRTRINWLKLSSQYFKYTGNTEKSYHYFQQFAGLKDSLDIADESLKSNDKDIAFRNNEQGLELALLSKDNALKNFYVAGAIFIMVLIAIILRVVWHNLKTSRRNVAKLSSLNQTINEQNLQMGKTLHSLEQSQEENVRLLKVVAHDLRSPVTSMLSLTSMLLSSSGVEPENREILELIKKSGNNCINLVSDLLNANDKSGDIKREPVDLAQMLNYCVAHLNNKAEEKGQEIILQTQPCTIPGNPEKLWRAISNLIANAIKFSPYGTIIDVTLVQNSNGALIAIKDQGIGIPEDLKEKIFTMPADSMRAGTAGEQSFGMGLSISKQIIEDHGGKLWFESQAGKGTTFFIQLMAN